MTSAVPPTEVAPAIVPHQPPSLNDLSSSEPTSVTPPMRNASPLSGSPHAARPVGASLSAGWLAPLSAGWLSSPPLLGLAPESSLHAARMSVRTARTAIHRLGCFRMCFLHTPFGALCRMTSGASGCARPDGARGAESAASYCLALCPLKGIRTRGRQPADGPAGPYDPPHGGPPGARAPRNLRPRRRRLSGARAGPRRVRAGALAARARRRRPIRHEQLHRVARRLRRAAGRDGDSGHGRGDRDVDVGHDR